MKSRGIAPTNLVYHALAVLNVASGKREAIEQLRAEMKEKGIVEHPLMQQAVARAELMADLPKLKKKQRTEAQIKAHVSIVGAELLSGAQLQALKEQLHNRVRGSELARREDTPRQPDEYYAVTKSELPEDWSEEDKQAALEHVAELNKEVLKSATEVQRASEPATLVPETEEAVKSVFMPTFYWTLHNQLRVLHANPSHFGLSPKGQELVAKYLTSIKPKAKKH